MSKQQGVYIPGVGTEKGGLLSSVRHFFGGAFGDGLSKNILQGYKWLIDTYKPGDEIFIIGFSRGAAHFLDEGRRTAKHKTGSSAG